MKVSTVIGALSSLFLVSSATILPRQSGKLPTISVRGNAFYAGDKRFYVRGVAYQPGGAADAADPLLDITSLKRDIANFRKLGVNIIRVYTIDNSRNHDEGMKLLDEAGIYLALDVNTPKFSLNRESIKTLQQSYNDIYLQSLFATVDAFAGYNNLAMFFSANEVINDKNNTNAAPYIKAVTRDLRQYISNRHQRKIPVGYSSADIAENIESQALYFNCGTDDERSDFFAFNDYSWCDPSSFEKSGWNTKVQTYKDYSIPLFLSEFGCITNRRDWNEIAALYSTRMSGVYSGGLAYEYTLEKNGYGLVEEGSNGEPEPNDDFDRLSAAFNKTQNPSGDGGARTGGAASKCPPASDKWNVKSTLLPAIPEPAKRFMTQGAGKGPGLGAESSQWRGTPSKSEAEPGSGQPSTTPTGGSSGSGSGNGTGSAASPAVGTNILMTISAVVSCSILVGAGLIL